MFQSVLSFFDSFMGTKGALIKNLFISSFRMLGESEIKALLISRVLYTAFCHCLALWAVISIVYHYHRAWGWLSLLFLVFVLGPYGFFFHINKRARQVWVAYAKITNRNDAYGESRKVVAAQKWRIRLFAIVEVVLSKANNNNDNSSDPSGIVQMLVATSVEALRGIFEIAESFLLPAIIIEKLTLTAAAQRLRQLEQNVPAALSGSFGLDIFGDVASGIMLFVYAGILAIGVALALLLPHYVNPDLVTNIRSTRDVVLFPVFVAIILISFLGRVIKIFVTSLQAVYFAIFYTTINLPNEIAPEKKDAITNYLTLNTSGV